MTCLRQTKSVIYCLLFIIHVYPYTIPFSTLSCTIYPSNCLPACLSVCLSICLFISPCLCLSVCLSLCVCERVCEVKKYSWLSLSRPRLSRITAYLEVKIWSLPIHENLITDGKYCRKEEKLLLRSNFSSFPQYFQYISNFRSPLPISLLNVVNQIIFSSILQTWYVELRISRSISESPLEFEITRVDCIYGYIVFS